MVGVVIRTVDELAGGCFEVGVGGCFGARDGGDGSFRVGVRHRGGWRLVGGRVGSRGRSLDVRIDAVGTGVAT